MSDHIPSEGGSEIPHIDSSGIIASPEEIEHRKKAEESSREKNYRQLLLDAETRQANAQHVQAGASRAIVGLTAALVIVSLVGGFVSFLQFRSADKSANAAKSAAETAAGNLALMKSSGAETKAQVDRLIEQQQRTASAMEGSLERSKAALGASIESSRNDQRAWVGPFGTQSNFSDSSGKKLYVIAGGKSVFTVEIKNFGKSPALRVQSSIGDVMRLSNWQFVPFYTSEANGPGSVLHPQSEVLLSTNADHIFTDAEIEGIKHSTYKVYVFGKIAYNDIFNRHHFTTFCMSVSPSLESLISCDIYNDAN